MQKNINLGGIGVWGLFIKDDGERRKGWIEIELQIRPFGKKISETSTLFKLLHFTKFDSQTCKSSVWIWGDFFTITCEAS